MARSAWRCETAISCAALRRNIGPSCCVSRRHFSKCSPPSSSGENVRTRCQVLGVRCQEKRGRFLEVSTPGGFAGDAGLTSHEPELTGREKKRYSLHAGAASR